MTTLAPPSRVAPIDTAPEETPGLRFTLREFSGSLGDLGTFLPLAAAMAAVNRLDLGVVFLFAGAMNITSGFLFRQPIPVQPMKAIAAVAIAEGLSPGSIAAAGMVMGVAMTAMALFSIVTWIDRVVPRPVIRGIQAGVGAKLMLVGLTWLADLPMLGADSVAIAIGVALVTALALSRRIPILLFVFIAGLVIAATGTGSLTAHHSWGVSVAPALPSAQEWITGITRGAVPQLPLTLLNSVLAVCALSTDFYPGKGVPTRRMALSVGLMNLVTVPFGAMPMCHGAGGLAAQHRFGARTGGSLVSLGAVLIVFALALGGALLPLIQAYPRSLLAVMILFAGYTLMKPARESLRDSRAAIVMLSTAAVIVLAGALEGFITGCAVAAIVAVLSRRQMVQR